MGRRQDGRIEPGQSLKSAISARAWNRAQDAADIVLGERMGFGAEGDASFSVRRVAVRVPENAITGFQWPAGVSVSVGHAIGLPNVADRAAMRNAQLQQFNHGNVEYNAVLTEGLLSPPSTQRMWLDAADLGLASEQFGVIESVTAPASTEASPRYYRFTCIVGGLFVCRAIAFGGFTDRLLGPPPLPANENLQPVWRPYPLMAPVGTARVLAIGAYWRVGFAQWPRVVECLVSM